MGLWVCLSGGVIDVVSGATADPVQAVKIGIGVLKFFSASIVGWLTFAIGAFIAGFLMELGK